jgi:hypothetical protein
MPAAPTATSHAAPLIHPEDSDACFTIICMDRSGAGAQPFHERPPGCSAAIARRRGGLSSRNRRRSNGYTAFATATTMSGFGSFAKIAKLPNSGGDTAREETIRPEVGIVLLREHIGTQENRIALARRSILRGRRLRNKRDDSAVGHKQRAEAVPITLSSWAGYHLEPDCPSQCFR